MFEIVHKLFAHRKLWHNLPMSELSEIYLSYMLRTMAISIIGIFIPVYLYDLGYEIYQIAIFFAFVYMVRLVIDPITSLAILKHGAKNVLKFSYPLMVINLGLLVYLQEVNIPLLAIALTQAVAISTFFISFNLEYSYLKNNSKEGSELSLLLILKKLASAVGPLVGGVVATLFGVSVTIYLAMIVTILASIPLYMNPDKAKVKNLKKFEFNKYLQYQKHFPAMFGSGLVVATMAVLWPLYLSVYVLDKNVYAALGFLVTVSFIVTIFSTKFFGKVIDNNSARTLLNFTSTANGLFMFLRPFITTFAGALAINFASDPVGNGQYMTEQKGFYDTAESEKHHRLSALVVLTSFFHVARIVIFMLVALVALVNSEELALKGSFFVAGLGSFLFMTQKFKVYENG